jgi:hypothetical protein
LQDVDDFKALNSLKAKESKQTLTTPKDGKGVKRKRKKSAPNPRRKYGKTDKGRHSRATEGSEGESEEEPAQVQGRDLVKPEDEELYHIDSVDSLDISDSSSEELKTPIISDKKKQTR